VKKETHSMLCTICARGGSKGVKDKNIRPLAGKPLIAYTIEDALRWGRARHVVVSTDSFRIAAVAKKYGAEVPFIRPARLATDNSPKLFSIRHALIECERIFGERYDIVVDLDATAPVRSVRDIENCFKIFLKKRPETIFSVVRAYKNPYFNMVEKRGDGFYGLCKKASGPITRRQATPQVYSMNASIYLYSRDFILNERNLTPFSGRTVVYVMGELSAHDIDNELDFQFIEFLMKKRIWKR
jgi:CMP-N-acetylneuraminic acid synthetase